MIPIVDDHCHLWFPPISEEVEEYIERNKKEGVIAIINNSSSIEQVKRSLEFKDSQGILFNAFGIHPIHALEARQEDLLFIEKNIDKAIAIGEVGLDYANLKEGEKEKQLELFEFFIRLSEKTQKPLIVHSRAAAREVVELLESSNARVVMHYFAGRKWLVKKILDHGWMLSIPTNIVKLQQLQDNVALAPMDQLLTETDAPWLSPYKDKYPNESRYIIETLRKIAEIKNLALQEVAEQIVRNFEETYKVKLER